MPDPDAPGARPTRHETRVRLGELTNELGAGTDFSLLCGYRTGASRDASLVTRISELHSHELP